MIKAAKALKWTVLLLSLWTAGCSTTSPGVSFYALSSVAARDDSIAARPRQAMFSVGVGPVALADYLDRPQLITREGPNQIRVNEFHRWGGALDSEIARTVAENLMTLLGSDQIMPIPWPGDFHPDLIVRLEIYAFEGAADGRARLRTTVAVTDRRSGSPALIWSTDLVEQAASRDPEASVAAQSRLLATLSRQIADRIETIGVREVQRD